MAVSIEGRKKERKMPKVRLDRKMTIKEGIVPFALGPGDAYRRPPVTRLFWSPEEATSKLKVASRESLSSS